MKKLLISAAVLAALFASPVMQSFAHDAQAMTHDAKKKMKKHKKKLSMKKDEAVKSAPEEVPAK